MGVLILGGCGLIGSALSEHLRDNGHDVTIAGRAARPMRDFPFRHCDMAQMTKAEHWVLLLEHITCVVNAAGALQDGPDDDLEAVHHHALRALAPACAARGIRIVQISAAGVCDTASTAFFRSKARGDAALLASEADSVILRPGLVLARDAYGGTRLLRMLAAMPLVQPVAMADSPMRCIGIGDLCTAVARAVAGDLPDGTVCDLVEDQSRALSTVVAEHRKALGFRPARVVTLPDRLLPPLAAAADQLGRLGWRSPLRTTALQVLREGIDGAPLQAKALGLTIAPLPSALQALHLGAEARLAARMALLMPVGVTVLVLFWALSGLIGLWQINTAASHLTAIGWPSALALLSVGF